MYLTGASVRPAAALVSTHTRRYLEALGQGIAAQQIASVSLRRQEPGLHGKKPCQLSFGET